jgi:hypothetical protein
MSQRISGYARRADDLYETPSWVTSALRPHMQNGKRSVLIWEPACGNGAIADVLKTWVGCGVHATDRSMGLDFLKLDTGICDWVITNPPYDQAEAFIDKALDAVAHCNGRVAMLLRVDFDSAKTRQRLFGRNPFFAKKLVLTSRIRWIPGTSGSPSFNHAWYIWDLNYNELDGARLVYHER